MTWVDDHRARLLMIYYDILDTTLAFYHDCSWEGWSGGQGFLVLEREKYC